MDDGNAGFKPSLSAHRRNHDVGLGYLREFGLTGVGVPCGSDRIEFKDEKQADRFLRIVEPHIIPSMRYKLEPECARLGTKIDGRKLQEAVDAGLTIAALMAEFKCAREPLKSKLAELGILHEVSELNPGASSDLSDRVIHERRHVTGRDLLVLPEDLLRDLVGTGASARQIAQRFGVHKNIVKRYLVKYGLPVPQARGGHRWTATEHVDVEMVRAGRIAGRTVQSLADEVGVRTSTLRNFMTRQGLD
jgi:transposase-like protein